LTVNSMLYNWAAASCGRVLQSDTPNKLQAPLTAPLLETPLRMNISHHESRGVV
jgi:hypothetical protein